MRVLGGLRLAEGTEIGNITLPVGAEFPEDENIGELFYLRGHATTDSGLYMCEEDWSNNGGLKWRLLVHVDSDALRTPILEIGSTKPMFLNSDLPTPIRWDYQSEVNDRYFSHSTEPAQSADITILKDGFFQVTYTINTTPDKKTEQSSRVYILVNGVAIVGRSVTNTLVYNEDYQTTNTNTFIGRFFAQDVLQVVVETTQDIKNKNKNKNNSVKMVTINENCGFSITQIGDL